VHERGKLLLVDEAHGAHFIFHPDLPPSSGEIGADMWVQSAHKTLPAFTQAAYLHVKGERIDPKRVSQILAMLQTSSPSYLIMASLDWARACMEVRGEELFQRLILQVRELKRKLKKQYGILTLDDYGGWEEVAATDPTRLTIDVRTLGVTGYQAEMLLRDAGIQVEMSDMYRLVSICSVADGKEEFDAFINGFGNLSGNMSLRGETPPSLPRQLSISREIPEQIMSPREAFYSIIENVPAYESIGRICAGVIGAYPPGIPRFCPGELINREGIEELIDIQRQGGNLFGLVDNSLIPVVKE
jgi:arginine/lysine/ornithine decarboxylase